MIDTARGESLNVFNVLDSLQEAISESKPLPWPMQNRSVINKEKFIRLLERTREILPEEVHQARWISRETQRIAEESTSQAHRVVKEAQSKAHEIVKAAESETQRRINEDEIVVAARQEAERILAAAKEQAEKMKTEADSYAETTRKKAEKFAAETREDADRYAMRILGGMESELSKILSIVKQGQESLSDQ